MRKLLDLICAPDGSLSASKLSYLLFVAVMTYKMCRGLPDDPWMWFVYGALVGGVDVAKKYVIARYIPDAGASPAPSVEGRP